MSNKKQTSVDWLAEQLHENAIKALVRREITLKQFTQKRDELLKTARQMHREEVDEAYFDGANDWKLDKYRGMINYYDKTFETP